MQLDRNIDLFDRPLTARSVIASLLLGMRPPRLSAARLVQWCGLFDIAEGTARVALSRMVERGECTTAEGTYELVGRMRARQPAQEWSLAPATESSSGAWRMAVVDPGPRSAGERAALRDAMRRLRYAETREGLWTRPANLPRRSAPEDAWRVAEAQCTWWTAYPDESGRDLADRLFVPHDWAKRARVLGDRLAAVTRALDAGDHAALVPGFVTGAAALAHVRADPVLPPEFCPRSWPGNRLRDGYRAYQGGFAVAVRDWFRAS